MDENLQFLKGITEEDLKNLKGSNPKGFVELAKKVRAYQVQLARTDVNHFIQYVMFDEVRRQPLRQAPYHITLQRFIDEHKYSVTIGHTESGKDLAVTEEVPTPNGWKTMGDLAVGDEVFALDGSITRVVATTRVFTDHKCYRLTFSDGAQVVAGEDHEWLVWHNHSWPNDQALRVVTTGDIAKQGTHGAGGAEQWSVPLPGLVIDRDRSNRDGRWGRLSKNLVKLEEVETVPTRCISVAHPSRTFLVGRQYTVTHNCVTGKTIFTDQHGAPTTALQIKARVDAGEEVSVLTLDTVSRRQRYVRVKSVFEDGVRPCYRIRTLSGRQTVVSGNHPFRVRGEGDTYRWLQAKNLTRNDYVVTTDTLAPPAAVAPSMPAEEAFALGFLVRTALQSNKYLKVSRHDLDSRGLPVVVYSTYLPAEVRHGVERVARQLAERHGWMAVRQGKALCLVGAPQWARSRGVDLRTGTSVLRVSPDTGLVIPASILSDEVAARAFAVGFFSSSLRRSVGMAAHDRQLDVPVYMAQTLVHLFNRVGVRVALSENLSIKPTPRKTYVSLVSRVRLYGQEATRLLSQARLIIGEGLDVAVAAAQYAAAQSPVRPMQWRPDRVLEVERVEDQVVYGVEIDDPQHTHLTDGILTHNTQQVSIARTLFEIGRDVNKRITILQSTGVLARDILKAITAHIESNPRLHEVFPHLKPGDMWTQTAITVQRGYGVKDPSIQVRGAFAKILGVRIDYLVADDILTLDYTRTKHMRERIREWFIAEVMSRLTADAKVILLGNAWHPEDLYHELMENPRWKGQRLPVRDPLTGITNWPEVWPQSRIEEFEAARTPDETARALDCIARSDDMSRFQEVWFRRALNRGIGLFGELTLLPSLESLPVDPDSGKPRISGAVYAGVDLSFTDRERSDWNAIFTVMVDANSHVYLLNIERFRGPTHETVRRIVDTHRRYGATIFVESVAAQRAVIDWCNAHHADVPVFPFNVRGQGEIANKWHGVYGVEMVAAELANNQWTLPQAGTRDDPGAIDPLIRAWIKECKNFNPSSHSGDILMASWLALRGARLYHGQNNMTAIELMGDAGFLPSSEGLSYSELRDRAGEAFFASLGVDLEPSPDVIEETRTFRL